MTENCTYDLIRLLKLSVKHKLIFLNIAFLPHIVTPVINTISQLIT